MEGIGYLYKGAHVWLSLREVEFRAANGRFGWKAYQEAGDAELKDSHSTRQFRKVYH